MKTGLQEKTELLAPFQLLCAGEEREISCLRPKQQENKVKMKEWLSSQNRKKKKYKFCILNIRLYNFLPHPTRTLTKKDSTF